MTGDKVISLRGGPIPQNDNAGAPSQYLIELFEAMLEDAKRGEITAVAFVTAGPKLASHNWYIEHGAAEDWVAMLGQVDLMHSTLRNWIFQQINRLEL